MATTPDDDLTRDERLAVKRLAVEYLTASRAGLLDDSADDVVPRRCWQIIDDVPIGGECQFIDDVYYLRAAMMWCEADRVLQLAGLRVARAIARID